MLLNKVRDSHAVATHAVAINQSSTMLVWVHCENSGLTCILDKRSSNIDSNMPRKMTLPLTYASMIRKDHSATPSTRSPARRLFFDVSVGGVLVPDGFGRP